MRLHRLLAPLAAALLAACAALPPAPPAGPAVAGCLELYEAVDRTVAQLGTRPSHPARIPGFPYLRVDRFLASFRDELEGGPQRRAWVAALARRDRLARGIELASLPASSRRRLAASLAPRRGLAAALDDCSETLTARDASHPARAAWLRREARVAPDYRTLNQVLGLYPLMALPVRLGVNEWHAEARHDFSLPLAALPVAGTIERYAPPETGGKAPPAGSIARDALGIPTPTEAQLEALYAAHAPVWEVDTTGDHDRPGAPYWRAGGLPDADTREPVAYRYASRTRFGGEVLLQLNYLIWFPERPIEGALDLLGGPLDGLNWRVTLDRDGRPLIYDAIHPCGCYHMFFPGERLRLRAAARRLWEPPLVPQPAPRPRPGERVVIRLSAKAHYVQRAYAAAPTGIRYRWRPYEALYSVPVAGGGRASLFGPGGIIPGTERAERWVLWPMGVPSAGAMRERGRHATAFIGRRHFDDARLIERLFERVAAPPHRATRPRPRGAASRRPAG